MYTRIVKAPWFTDQVWSLEDEDEDEDEDEICMM